MKNVSVLFNEPKLLKSTTEYHCSSPESNVSVLFNEPKLLKLGAIWFSANVFKVSVLFNEPKLLK